MRTGRLILAGVLVAGTAAAQDMSRRPVAFPAADTATALHLLNRLTFGPRPGDIAAVQRLGIERWLDQQLRPARIADPVAAVVRTRFPEAFDEPADLYRAYPPPNVVRRQNERMAERGDTMEMVRDRMNGRRIGGAVVLATLTRHAQSERQLQEVLTDFWFNHFNVFIGKQADRWLTGDYVERAIRPNVLGKFEDLLGAVAHHPAMLVYLDNAQSVATGSRPPAMARRAIERMPDEVQRRMPTGINENYGRELLELHTLGVDGGYTQQDVQSAARILTGWSIVGPGLPGGGPMGGRRGARREPFSFEFRDWAHDRGEKVVLGIVFPAGHLQDEGERLLTVLARHPSTARHLSHKLCARLVSDHSPDGCVDQAVATWRRTEGDIAAVVRSIVSSPDFWAEPARRTKVKSPLEFLASALRATGTQPDSTPRLAGVLQQLGQPLFQQQVPTGYPETQESWVNSGALLGRMNIAVALAAGRLAGTEVDLEPVVSASLSGDALVARVNAVILGGQGSQTTLRVIRDQIADVRDPLAARALAVGLALGSPEFQKQ